jgi:hypothetical protein
MVIVYSLPLNSDQLSVASDQFFTVHCPLFTVHCSYQLDFITPGSLPWEARFRKQIRQIPNFRKNPLGLPHMGHLLYALTLNLGFFMALFLSDFLSKSTDFSVISYPLSVFHCSLLTGHCSLVTV